MSDSCSERFPIHAILVLSGDIHNEVLYFSEISQKNICLWMANFWQNMFHRVGVH